MVFGFLKKYEDWQSRGQRFDPAYLHQKQDDGNCRRLVFSDHIHFTKIKRHPKGCLFIH